MTQKQNKAFLYFWPPFTSFLVLLLDQVKVLSLARRNCAFFVLRFYLCTCRLF